VRGASHRERIRAAGLRVESPDGPSTLDIPVVAWQSLTRSTGSVETAYLNGEIVLLGRLHGVPTPVNELLQMIINEIARDGLPPGQLTTEQFLARLPSAVTAPVAAS